MELMHSQQYYYSNINKIMSNKMHQARHRLTVRHLSLKELIRNKGTKAQRKAKAKSLNIEHI